MRSNAELVRQVAEIVYRLPPMPENVERLLRPFPRTTDDLQDVMQVIAGDPGVCADLLQLANACSVRSAPIDTIEQAVAAIGVDTLIQLIGTSYANETIRQEFAGLAHLKEYFIHSREISRTSRLLADAAGLPGHVREMYNVAGLIHDMGRLVIMIAADKTSAPLMGTSWDQMTSVIHDEQEALGMNHCDVGQQVCANWGFAPLLQEGVLRHHTPLRGDSFSYPGALIFMAHFVASSDFTGEILSRMLPPELFTRLGLTMEAFADARDRYARLYARG